MITAGIMIRIKGMCRSDSSSEPCCVVIQQAALADLGGVPGAHPLKGPDSFVLTYKIFET